MFTNLPTNQKKIKEYIFLLEIFHLNIKYCEKNLKILWNYIIVSITQHLKTFNLNSSMIEIFLQLSSSFSQSVIGLHKEMKKLDLNVKFFESNFNHSNSTLDNFLFQEAEKFFLYQPFTAAIKLGCYGAIWLSERIWAKSGNVKTMELNY